MDFLTETQQRSRELADYLQRIVETPLEFHGDYPLAHSAANHRHLFFLEACADNHPWISVEYRTRFVQYVFQRWRERLKGMKPYLEDGYRLYLYEDLAPTISVVANTPDGCPYARGTEPYVVFTKTPREVMALYAGRSWRAIFSECSACALPDESRILAAVKRQRGSISAPTARDLGLAIGKLRILIGMMGLGEEVNDIRKHHHRRPATFHEDPVFARRWHLYEEILPARYR